MILLACQAMHLGNMTNLYLL